MCLDNPKNRESVWHTHLGKLREQGGIPVHVPRSAERTGRPVGTRA
jgi:hypothetical protein